MSRFTFFLIRNFLKSDIVNVKLKIHKRVCVSEIILRIIISQSFKCSFRIIGGRSYAFDITLRALITWLEREV